MPALLTQEEKLKTVGKVMDQLNAKKKKRNPVDDRPAIYYAGKRPDLLDHGIIKTGNLAFDRAVHGGLKRSSLTTLWGLTNCGKTSLSLEAIANAQKEDLVCAYVHSEACFPSEHARMLGVDLEKLIIIQDFTSGEEAFNMLVDLLSDDNGIPRNILDLVVVDSIAALMPKYVLDKIDDEGLEGQEMGSLPKMLTNATRRIFGTGALGKTAMIFINQARDNLGSYGGGLQMPGGRAVKHFSHVIVQVKAPRSGWLFEGTGEKKKRVGHTVILDIEKNKAGLGGHPGETVEYQVRYNLGTDNILPLFNAALVSDVIANISSGWFQFKLPKEFLSPLGLWREEKNAKGEVKLDEPLKIRGQEAVLTILRTTEPIRNVLISIIRDGTDPDVAIRLETCYKEPEDDSEAEGDGGAALDTTRELVGSPV